MARQLLPAVLRDEPQYRLLFSSQVLSIIGDRVTMVALPFATLSVGGDVGVGVAGEPALVLGVVAGVTSKRGGFFGGAVICAIGQPFGVVAASSGHASPASMRPSPSRSGGGAGHPLARVP